MCCRRALRPATRTGAEKAGYAAELERLQAEVEAEMAACRRGRGSEPCGKETA